MKIYIYACLLRPPTFAVPKGWKLLERGRHDVAPLRTDLPLGPEPYGVIGYERRLSVDEVRNYDLRFLNAVEFEVRAPGSLQAPDRAPGAPGSRLPRSR